MALSSNTQRKLIKFDECKNLLAKAVKEGRAIRHNGCHYQVGSKHVSIADALRLLGHGDKVKAL